MHLLVYAMVDVCLIQEPASCALCMTSWHVLLLLPSPQLGSRSKWLQPAVQMRGDNCSCQLNAEMMGG